MHIQKKPREIPEVDHVPDPAHTAESVFSCLPTPTIFLESVRDDGPVGDDYVFRYVSHTCQPLLGRDLRGLNWSVLYSTDSELFQLCKAVEDTGSSVTVCLDRPFSLMSGTFRVSLTKAPGGVIVQLVKETSTQKYSIEQAQENGSIDWLPLFGELLEDLTVVYSHEEQRIVYSNRDLATFPMLVDRNTSGFINTHIAKKYRERFQSLLSAHAPEPTALGIGIEWKDESHWLQCRLLPIYSWPGHSLLIFRDTTESKSLEKEVRRQAAFIDKITASVPDIIIIADFPSREIKYFRNNPAPVKHFNTELFLNMTVAERAMMVHEDDRGSLKEFYQRVNGLMDGEIIQIQYRHVTRDHKTLWFNMRTSVFERHKNGKVKSILQMIEDITEKKESERALNEQLHFTRQVTVTVPDIIAVVNLSSFELIYANREAFGLNGFCYDTFISLNRNDRTSMVFAEDRQLFIDYLVRLRSSNDSETQQVEFRAMNSLKEVTWLRIRGRVFKRAPDGAAIESIHVIQNITQQKVVEQEIMDLKLRQQKSVLNAIMMTEERERARIGEALHDGVAQLLYLIQVRLNQMHETSDVDLIRSNEILELISRAIADTRQLAFQLVPVVLGELGVEKALRTLFDRISTETCRISFRKTDLQNRLSSYYEFVLYRAIQELVNNALRHSKAANVWVDMVEDNHFLTVTVEDNGAGFTNAGLSGIGIKSLKRRLTLLDGSLKLVNTGPTGSMMRMCVPLKSQVYWDR